MGLNHHGSVINTTQEATDCGHPVFPTLILGRDGDGFLGDTQVAQSPSPTFQNIRSIVLGDDRTIQVCALQRDRVPTHIC